MSIQDHPKEYGPIGRTETVLKPFGDRGQACDGARFPVGRVSADERNRRLFQLRCIAHALVLCDSPHAAEFAGLREAYLSERERPQPPNPQLTLLAVRESNVR